MYFCAFSGCSRVATNEEKEEGRKKGEKKDKGEIEAREIQMHHALMFTFTSTVPKLLSAR